MGLFDKLPARKSSLTATDYYIKGQKAYYESCEYEKAVRYFREGAEEFNDSKCQYWVGALHYVGQGVERDYEMAIPWLKRAAKEGEGVLPHLMLGSIYIAGGYGVEKNTELAEFWFDKAAAIDSKLFRYAGDIFRRGRCNKIGVDGLPFNSFEFVMIEKDYLKALEWYLKAHDQGRKDVYFKIAQVFYDGGFGLEKDYRQALYWFQKDVKAGNTATCALICDIFSEGGFGVKQDYQQALSWCKKGDSFCYYKAGLIYQYYFEKPDYENALEWYMKSLDGAGPHENTYFRIAWLHYKGLGVAKCHAEANKYLLKDKTNGFRGFLYHYGIGAPVNYKLAFYFYKIGIENSPSGFVYNGMGLLYQKGHGVTQNHERAMLYFQKAASLNSTDAFNSLGDVYYYGYGVKTDYEKAFDWYKKAADGLDDNNGQFNLGRMYFEGKGTEVDYKLAFFWFKKALVLGNRRAYKYVKHASIMAKLAQDNRRLSTQLLQKNEVHQSRLTEAQKIAKEEREKVAMLESQLKTLRAFTSEINSDTSSESDSSIEPVIEAGADMRTDHFEAQKFFHI